MTRPGTKYTLRHAVTLICLFGASFGASCGDVTATGVWDERTMRAYLKDVNWDGQVREGHPGSLIADCIDRRWTDSLSETASVVAQYDTCKYHRGNAVFDIAQAQFLMGLTLTDLTTTEDGGRGQGFAISSRPERGKQTRFFISLDGDTNGSYDVNVRITKWTGLQPKPSCSLKAADIDLGTVGPDEIRTGGSILTIKCNVDTGVTVRVGGRDGSADVPYAPGGVVRMSFAESQGGGSNVYRVQAKKNQSLDAILKATTVPGSADPGTYTASAVITAELQ